MIIKTPSSNPARVNVRFELPPAIWADSVFLVGDFNQWNEASHPMTRGRNDPTWSISLELDRDKTRLLYTSPSPRDSRASRMPSSA